MGTTEFADRLRNLMDESHIKQKELAQRARITEAALWRYLNDGRIPRIDVVANLATVLNTTTDYLLSRTERDDDDRDFFGIKRLVAERGIPPWSMFWSARWTRPNEADFGPIDPDPEYSEFRLSSKVVPL